MLRMDLTDEKFEAVLGSDFRHGPPPAHLHPGAHRVYPHPDPEALAEEIAEVFAFRCAEDYLP